MLLKCKQCIDAGTENCPCRLAEYGKCIVCSRLCAKGNPGADSCDGHSGSPKVPEICSCEWQGICIYNEYLQNGSSATGPAGCDEKQKTGSAGQQRQSLICKIQKIIRYEEDLAVMQVEVPAGLAAKASLPGSYVFMKRSSDEPFFYTPLSIMKADYEERLLHIAVQVNGPKTKSLIGDMTETGEICREKDKLLLDDATAEADYGEVELRGIYRNGLLGAQKLMECGRPLRVLCLTKGLGLAPVANYIRWAEDRHFIDVIADLDKISRKFAEDALDGAIGGSMDQVYSSQGTFGGVNSVTFGKLPLDLSWAVQEKYDLIVISASDYFQKNIYVPESKKVLSNNHTMCCGEGICGACICMDAEGTVRRMCKACEVK